MLILVSEALRYLVVDMQRVLEESSAGKRALVELRAFLRRTEAQHLELTDKYVKAAGPARKAARDALLEFEAKRQAAVEKHRAATRDVLIEQARAELGLLAQARGVTLVLEKKAALVFEPSAEITDEVIQRLDASG